MIRAFILILIILSTTVSARTVSLSTNDSIQEALNSAIPGDVINLSGGIYYQSFDTVRHGTVSSPILIQGQENTEIKGDGRHRMIQVFHDHIHFDRLIFNGLNGDAQKKESYTNKLVYVQGQSNRGVEGLKITNSTFMNSGGEALRLRYFVKNAEIAQNRFLKIGVFDFKFSNGGKNGEAIYIGTSSNQWDDGTNPTVGPDESTGNWIHHNYFDTRGNECIDIKEGAYQNTIEYNICTGQMDADSGGISARGDRNIIRYNEIFGNLGVGVRLGGHKIDDVQYGKDNEVYGNYIYSNGLGPFKTEVENQYIENNYFEPKKIDTLIVPKKEIMIDNMTQPSFFQKMKFIFIYFIF